MSIPISILIGYWLPNQMLRIAMEIYPFVDVFFPSTILHLQGISGQNMLLQIYFLSLCFSSHW